MFGNDVMIGQNLATDASFSYFNIALLKDTGFYAEVIDTFYDPKIFGKDAGCTFLTGSCADLLTFHEFQDSTTGVMQCDFYLHGHGFVNSMNDWDDCYETVG